MKNLTLALCMQVLGQAQSFKMLDPNTDDPSKEIRAARDTGAQLEQTIRALIAALERENG